MKTAIYIEDGTVQLVLTPESSFEKNAIKSFADKPLSVQVFEGSFYDCRGGWAKQTEFNYDASPYMVSENRDKSIILKIDERGLNGGPE